VTTTGEHPRTPCALCDREQRLVRSHVLPEFLYEHAYDETGSYVELDFGRRPRQRIRQVGLRQHLLCSECDGRLGRWESASAQILRRVVGAQVEPSGLIEIRDFDYTSFKLFAISLLWRFDVTRLGFFSAVRLGPFSNVAKRLLLNGTPGPPHLFGFAIARSAAYEIARTVLTPPEPIRYQGCRGYFFLAYGFTWAFVVSADSNQLRDYFPFVGAETTLKVPVLEQSRDSLLTYLRSAIMPGLNRLGERHNEGA
jgi:hypothetical protein